jgi:hypothetical protein
MAKIKIEDTPLDEGDQDFQRLVGKLARKRNATTAPSKKSKKATRRKLSARNTCSEPSTERPSSSSPESGTTD